MYSTSDLYYLKKLHSLMGLDHKGIEYSFGVPVLYQPVLGLVLLMNVVLTPYILYLILRLKKWNWLVYFCILMVFLAGIGQILSEPWHLLSRPVFFLLLVLYMYLLRLKVNEWNALASFNANLRRERLLMGQRNISG